MFIVTAKDKGDPSLSGTATVRIHTEKKEDKAPIVRQKKYPPTKILLASKREPEIIDLQDEEPYCDYIFKGKKVYWTFSVLS